MKDNFEQTDQAQNQPKKKKASVLVWALCGALVAVGIGAMLLFGTRGTAQNEGSDAPVRMADIETAYGTLHFPEAYMPFLHHEEVREETTLEIFSMICDDGEKELFRICFGNVEEGSPVGYLHTDAGVIPVSVMVAEGEAESFPDEESRTRCMEMRACVNTVLDSITADERFSASGLVEEEKLERKLTYWTLLLPEGMECEESHGADVYQVDFYGTVGGERRKLYAIRLDDSDEPPSIGVYSVDGVAKQIHIETENPELFDGLPEEERRRVSIYMDTVNDVIGVIMRSENYADGLPPEA